MEIKNNKIKLREFKEEDKERLSNLLDNINISRWLLVYPSPFKLEDAEKTLKHMIKRSLEEPRTSYNLAIELLDTGELIGGIGLTKIDLTQKTGGVMYWLGENYWKKGYGAEALKGILDFAFNKLDLRRINAEVYPGNDASASLLKKFGFIKEGHLRQSAICNADKKIKDTFYYGLLKEDYKLLL